MASWDHGRRGPSTLLRTIPSHVEGWRSLVVAFGNPADGGEASTADAPTAGERVDPIEARATEPAPDPPCGREAQPPREDARRWADLMGRTFGIDVLACPRCGPSALLRAILSTVEGWRALQADRAHRRGLGDRAHSAPSAPAHRGPHAASGAGTAASRDRLVQPGHGRRGLQLLRVIGVRRCRVAGGPAGRRAGRRRTHGTGLPVRRDPRESAEGASTIQPPRS